MTELLVPILLLGLADSLNPVTIAVAVLLATGRRPVPRLAAYTFGTGLAYFLGGLVLALGPAVLLRALLSRRDTTPAHIAELVVGVGALVVAAYLFSRAPESAGRRVPTELRPPRSFLLGAGITFVDLPTALMYFGAIALVVGADLNVTERVVLLAIFNVAYVFPLIGITTIAAVMRGRAEPVLERVRDFVARWGHRVLAALTAGSGCYLIVIGIRGLAR
jgi:cytochrome c biogenesis protein CcdA